MSVIVQRCGTEEQVAVLTRFLHTHEDTAFFLLANLVEHGPHRGAFTLFVRGSLHVETTLPLSTFEEMCPTLLAVIEEERKGGFPFHGVLARRELACLLRDMLLRSGQWTRVTTDDCDHIFALDLLQPTNVTTLGVVPPGVKALQLQEEHFPQYDRLSQGLMRHNGFPVELSVQERQTHFRELVARGVCWGVEIQGEHHDLVCSAILSAVIPGEAGIVGGVYCEKLHRRRGFGQLVMQRLLFDATHTLGLKKIILFTHPERNVAARHMYRKLGFHERGFFGVVFGEEGGPPSVSRTRGDK